MRILLLVYLVAIILDYVFGVALAYMQGNLKSRIMRDGAIRKGCEFGLAVFLCIVNRYVPSDYIAIIGTTAVAYMVKMITAETVSMRETLKTMGGGENEEK